MRKGVLLFIILLATGLFADDFIIDKFYLDKTDLSARTEARTDVNDEFCAIIKVRTDIDNLKFHSNQLENIEFKNNEYWLFVSPGVKYLEIIKSGFITKSYLIPQRVQSSNVYH